MDAGVDTYTTSLKMPRDLRDQIQKVSDSTGASFAEITRRALAAYIQQHDAKVAALAEAGL
ncbi:hypothetical protein BurMR1_3044 [Burkholderia sp. MR1]|nr:hypothetical protein BurMR1_3044 [Burkholderia sp. MR1]